VRNSETASHAAAYGNSNCTSESNSHGYPKSNWDPDRSTEACADSEAASHAGAAPDAAVDIEVGFLFGSETNVSAHHFLKSPVCSCVSITLPASS
jgi:hypothetical protein